MILTIGHSTRRIEDFIGMLRAHGVERLIDVRTIPKSRYNPQFHTDALRESLTAGGVGYDHMRALGGLRKPRPDSPNTGWRNGSFRGYADHMQTPEFNGAIEDLIALSEVEQIVVMCAESVPWRCHRSLIADALTVRGIEVEHIMTATKRDRHSLTRFAVPDGHRITYPPEGPAQLPLLV
jgi:uncharacterized protein (DUF488 family)